MSNLKDALCLLAVLIAYGIAGRMDYDDAVKLEEVQRATATAECTASEALRPDDPMAQTTTPVPAFPGARHREVSCARDAL